MKVTSRAPARTLLYRVLLASALTATTFVATGVAAPAPAAAQQKRVLDHDAYEIWRTIEGERISPDGAWVLYTLSLRTGDDELVVRRPRGAAHRIPRAGRGRFVGSEYAVFTIRPARDSVRALKLAETPSKDLPPDTLGILDLTTGQVTRVPGVGDWSTPDEGPHHFVAYLLEPEGTEENAESPEAVGGEPVPGEPAPEPVPGEPGPEPVPGEPASGGEADDPDELEDRDPSTLVFRDLVSGREQRFQDVVEHTLAESGAALAFATGADSDAAGVYRVDTSTGQSTPVLTGRGRYTGLTFSDDGGRLAFLSHRDDRDADRPDTDQPEYGLYLNVAGDTRRVARQGTEGIPGGWWVSEHGSLSFSASGTRLFFGTSPRPEPDPEEDALPEDRVVLDVWHWQDDYIQPMQLLNAEDERRRTYRAVAHLDRDDAIVQLATPGQPSVTVGAEGDAAVALAQTGVPYRSLVGIESPGFSDVWLVDVLTGERRRVLENVQARAHLSPDAGYLAWYDYGDRHWHAMDIRSRERVNLSSGIPHPVWDELDDHPMPPRPYGTAGWTAGDEVILIYDRYDIWAVDPRGRSTPRRVTEGHGRENGIEFRYVRLDEDERAVDASSPILLAAFDTRTKEGGFYRDRVSGASRPERLVFEPAGFGRPEKARDADVVLYTRESVSEFPDLWLADTRFRGARRLSEANPQQAEYNWATVELVEWLSNDGIPLQGLLYRPEDFDPSREYPMMVYFYERSSDGLHDHVPPLPHRSAVRPTFYASRGYIVFVPDIVYRDGYPGESAMDAVMPGVLRLAEEPWVDETRVGVQGHSWGGYQIAHMITRTDFFRAAGAGAPVANMTSAYGGVRYGSGMSRMFQYERTQSRIGGSLWERPLQYLENSPLFFLEGVSTPVLIMHNDQDAAVPWTQGIELFLGLRRLGKPAWLINYNDEPHWPTTAANIRDWNIRMQQYFDHYLKGEPAPRWLVDGIPATEKGRTLGLEPADGAVATEGQREPVGDP